MNMLYSNSNELTQLATTVYEMFNSFKSTVDSTLADLHDQSPSQPFLTTALEPSLIPPDSPTKVPLDVSYNVLSLFRTDS